MVDPRLKDFLDQLVLSASKPPSWRSRLRTVWSETGRSLQKAWIALWAVGLILLALGVWGDSAQFWRDRPYLTNLVSALTGAAFGIPLALIILQRVTAAETDAAEARAAHRMAVRVSSDLVVAAKLLVDYEISGEDEVSKVRAAKAYLEGQRDAIPHYPDGPLPYINALNNVSEFVGKLWHPEITEILAEVSALWSILTDVSRPRLLETGGGWLSGPQESELGRLVSTVTKTNLENWRQEGSSLLAEFNRLAGDDMSLEGLSVDPALDRFNSWLGQIINLVDEAGDLISKSAATEQLLASS